MTETAGRLPREGGHEIAWRRREGAAPTLVWFGGARSQMSATKAATLDGWAQAQGRALLRFDYFGHGASTGAFGDGTIGRWRADGLAVVDALTTGPLVLVGSSLGGWIAALVAAARPERTTGLLLVAPAPDYPDKLIEPVMTAADRDVLARDGAFTDADGERYAAAFLEDARRWSLLPGPAPITAPVRVLQGEADAVVPWRHALAFAQSLPGPDVAFTLVRDGDHRLSRPQDVARLLAFAQELCGADGAAAPSRSLRDAGPSARARR